MFTMSSSDGQRFPVRGKSATARHMCRFQVTVPPKSGSIPFSPT